MNRRDAVWFAAMALLTLLAAASAPAFPQEPAAAMDLQQVAAEPQVGDETPGAAASGDDATGNDATVERILRQQEELIRGQRFSYDPEGRRDPFQSLYEIVNRPPEGQRPPGVRGMLVSELDLDGIVQDSDDGDIAFFKGSDNKGYFLRVGDGVFDGKLIAIDPRKGAVTFRQKLDDPRMIKPYRDVTLRLTPMDEETVNE